MAPARGRLAIRKNTYRTKDVKGYYVDGVFQASELLAKHDETYMPAEVIDMLKEQGVYQDPNG